MYSSAAQLLRATAASRALTPAQATQAIALAAAYERQAEKGPAPPSALAAVGLPHTGSGSGVRADHSAAPAPASLAQQGAMASGTAADTKRSTGTSLLRPSPGLLRAQAAQSGAAGLEKVGFRDGPGAGQPAGLSPCLSSGAVLPPAHPALLPFWLFARLQSGLRGGCMLTPRLFLPKALFCTGHARVASVRQLRQLLQRLTASLRRASSALDVTSPTTPGVLHDALCQLLADIRSANTAFTGRVPRLLSLLPRKTAASALPGVGQLTASASPATSHCTAAGTAPPTSPEKAPTPAAFQGVRSSPLGPPASAGERGSGGASVASGPMVRPRPHPTSPEHTLLAPEFLVISTPHCVGVPLGSSVVASGLAGPAGPRRGTVAPPRRPSAPARTPPPQGMGPPAATPADGATGAPGSDSRSSPSPDTPPPSAPSSGWWSALSTGVTSGITSVLAGMGAGGGGPAGPSPAPSAAPPSSDGAPDARQGAPPPLLTPEAGAALSSDVLALCEAADALGAWTAVAVWAGTQQECGEFSDDEEGPALGGAWRAPAAPAQEAKAALPFLARAAQGLQDAGHAHAVVQALGSDRAATAHVLNHCARGLWHTAAVPVLEAVRTAVRAHARAAGAAFGQPPRPQTGFLWR